MGNPQSERYTKNRSLFLLDYTKKNHPYWFGLRIVGCQRLGWIKQRVYDKDAGIAVFKYLSLFFTPPPAGVGKGFFSCVPLWCSQLSNKGVRNELLLLLWTRLYDG